MYYKALDKKWAMADEIQELREQLNDTNRKIYFEKVGQLGAFHGEVIYWDTQIIDSYHNKDIIEIVGSVL